MKDEAPFLDMPEGLNGVRYKQEFVRASKSQYPDKSPHRSMEVPMTDAMRMSLGK